MKFLYRFLNVATYKLKFANLNLIPSQATMVANDLHKTLNFSDKIKFDTIPDCFNLWGCIITPSFETTCLKKAIEVNQNSLLINFAHPFCFCKHRDTSFSIVLLQHLIYYKIL